MLVRNETNTSHDTRKRSGETWKHLWIRKSGREWPKMCRIAYCNNEATDGAHVEKKGACGDFILPMCHDCNIHKTDWMNTKKKDSYAQCIQKCDLNC